MVKEMELKIRVNDRDTWTTKIHDEMDMVEFMSVIERFKQVSKVFPIPSSAVLAQRTRKVGNKVWSAEQNKIIAEGLAAGKKRGEIAKRLFGDEKIDATRLSRLSNKMTTMKAIMVN